MLGIIAAGSLSLAAATLSPFQPAALTEPAVRLGPPASYERDLPVSRSVVRQHLPKAVKVVKVKQSVKLTPRGYALSRVGATQFRCLNLLWYRESQWRWWEDNPTSSAYGIPQALPGSRMASAGADWRTNPYTQIRWGIQYIKDRYGTPCAAWTHSEQRGWY